MPAARKPQTKRKPSQRKAGERRGGKRSTSWKPGQSGNPSGTSKTPPEVRAFLTKVALENVVRIAALAAGKGEWKDAEPALRFAAMRVLHDATVNKLAVEKPEAGDAKREALDLLRAALLGDEDAEAELTADDDEEDDGP